MTNEEIEAIVLDIMREREDMAHAMVRGYRLTGWFVGQTMKRTNGTLNPLTVFNVVEQVARSGVSLTVPHPPIMIEDDSLVFPNGAKILPRRKVVE